MKAHQLSYPRSMWTVVLCLLALGPLATRADNTADSAAGLWEQSKDLAGSAWKSTLDALGVDTAGDNGFAELWEDLVPRLEETLGLEEEQETLPEHAWLGEDQESNQQAIDQLLDQAADLLAVSPSQNYRQRIRSHEQEIAKLQREIDDYRRKRVSAPQDSVWSKTVAEYDTAIDERKNAIEQQRRAITAIKKEFAAELRRLGVDISDEQLDVLLSTVVGDDLIRMAAAFDNVKSVTVQLERLMDESREDLVTARRYYGMYTVLLKILVRMHQHLLESIDQRYLARIDAIMTKTRKLQERTILLLRQSAQNRDTLSANLAAQSLTLRAAGEYRRYLLDQRRNVEQVRRRLAHDLDIAMNTYETVKVSGELVALMRSSQRSLNALRHLKMPVLRGFQNIEMKREFERLTQRLRQGERA